MRFSAKPVVVDDKIPVRSYQFTCKCGSHTFTIDWAMYNDMEGEPRFFCASCERRCIPTEPMEYTA